MTKKEAKKNIYLKNVETMVNKGFTKEDFVIPKHKVIVFGGSLSIILIIMVFVVSRMIIGMQPDFELSYPLFTVQIIASLVVHEILHGAGWLIGGKCNFKDITFGVSALFPYCNCNKPLYKGQYLVGVLLPGCILGVGSFLMSMLTSNLWFVFLAAINLAIASGDILIAVSLKKVKDAKILDHPYEAGFVAFVKS